MEPQAQSIIIQISLAVNCQCASRWLLIYPPKTHYQNMSSLDAGNFGSALPSLTVERHHRRNSAAIEQWKVHSFTWLNFFSWITVGQTVWQLIKYMQGTLSVRFMLCHISNGPPRNHWNQRESNACLRYHTVHRPVISLQTHWSIAQNGLVPISCLTCTWNDAHPPTWGCFSWTPPQLRYHPFTFKRDRLSLACHESEAYFYFCVFKAVQVCIVCRAIYQYFLACILLVYDTPSGQTSSAFSCDEESQSEDSVTMSTIYKKKKRKEGKYV